MFAKTRAAVAKCGMKLFATLNSETQTLCFLRLFLLQAFCQRTLLKGFSHKKAASLSLQRMRAKINAWKQAWQGPVVL